MQRAQHRRQRAKQGIPVVSLVGYTNAGKSTLMRALSGADVLVQNQLFATLDPVTRRIRLPLGGVALLTDTVGFIQKLPTQLVAAFRATLEELEEATLLLHVIDITHPDAEEQAHTVEETLSELGLKDRPRVTVLNKADLIRREEQGDRSRGTDRTPPVWAREGVPVSLREAAGLGELALTDRGGVGGGSLATSLAKLIYCVASTALQLRRRVEHLAAAEEDLDAVQLAGEGERAGVQARSPACSRRGRRSAARGRTARLARGVCGMSPSPICLSSAKSRPIPWQSPVFRKSKRSSFAPDGTSLSERMTHREMPRKLYS